MSAYNTVSAKLVCPSCGALVDVVVQFKYGNTWQLHYKVGETLKWGGNDVGEREKRLVVVDGVVEKHCAHCGYGESGRGADQEWNTYVVIEHDRITGVENASGR